MCSGRSHPRSCARPAADSFSYPISAISGDTPKEPRGAFVLPGAYVIRMTVNGRTFAQGLTVKMDPRVSTPAADLRLMHDTSRAIDALMRRVTTALGEMRSAKQGDLEQRLTRAGAPLSQLFAAVESADAGCDACFGIDGLEFL